LIRHREGASGFDPTWYEKESSFVGNPGMGVIPGFFYFGDKVFLVGFNGEGRFKKKIK